MSINSTEAKALEDFVINSFARGMERRNIEIELPSTSKATKNKIYRIKKWSNTLSSGIFAKPYKVEKDDSDKIKEYDSELNISLFPVNKILMYTIPKKITIGVWVRCRVEKYIKGKNEDDEPMTREELMTTLQTLVSLTDSSIKIFGIYSVTGWDKEIWDKDLTPQRNLFYALIHEGIKPADENKFRPYKALFPIFPKDLINPQKKELKSRAKVKEEALTREDIEKVKKMLTEGIPPQATSVATQPKTGWKERLTDWNTPHSITTLNSAANLSEDELKNMVRLIVTDSEAREFFICLVNKWNNTGQKCNIYYGFYEKTQIFEKVKGYIGMLYSLSILISRGEIQIFTDEIRYFKPILDFYSQADYARNFPIIDSEIITNEEGDRVTRYYVK